MFGVRRIAVKCSYLSLLVMCSMGAFDVQLYTVKHYNVQLTLVTSAKCAVDRNVWCAQDFGQMLLRLHWFTVHCNVMCF